MHVVRPCLCALSMRTSYFVLRTSYNPEHMHLFLCVCACVCMCAFVCVNAQVRVCSSHGRPSLSPLTVSAMCPHSHTHHNPLHNLALNPSLHRQAYPCDSHHASTPNRRPQPSHHHASHSHTHHNPLHSLHPSPALNAQTNSRQTPRATCPHRQAHPCSSHPAPRGLHLQTARLKTARVWARRVHRAAAPHSTWVPATAIAQRLTVWVVTVRQATLTWAHSVQCPSLPRANNTTHACSTHTLLPTHLRRNAPCPTLSLPAWDHMGQHALSWEASQALSQPGSKA